MPLATTLSALTLVLFLSPFLYNRLVLSYDPPALSYATCFDGQRPRLTVPTYTFAIVMMASIGGTVAVHARRLTSMCTRATAVEWGCTASVLLCVVAAPGGEAWVSAAGFGVAVLHAVVAALPLCSPPTVQSPSRLTPPLALALLLCYVTSAATNVLLPDGTLPLIHTIAASVAYLSAFPLLVALRSRTVRVPAFMLLAALNNTLFFADIGSVGGGMQPRYFIQLTAQLLLSWAFASATRAMLQ